MSDSSIKLDKLQRLADKTVSNKASQLSSLIGCLGCHSFICCKVDYKVLSKETFWSNYVKNIPTGGMSVLLFWYGAYGGNAAWNASWWRASSSWSIRILLEMSECISAVYVQNKRKVIKQVSSSFTAGLKIHRLHWSLSKLIQQSSFSFIKKGDWYVY